MVRLFCWQDRSTFEGSYPFVREYVTRGYWFCYPVFEKIYASACLWRKGCDTKVSSNCVSRQFGIVLLYLVNCKTKTRVFFSGTHPGYALHFVLSILPILLPHVRSHNLQRPFPPSFAGTRPEYFERNASATLCLTARVVCGTGKHGEDRERRAPD